MIPYRIPKIVDGLLQDPHVVIIGAGASKAACPNGDRNGNMVPLLKDVCRVGKIADILSSYNFNEKLLLDFEQLYSSICKKPKNDELIVQLENEIREYFGQLQLPEEINLYDYLLLSLTEKDAIISFNWDPFLMQAYIRNRAVGNLPRLIFPHGNVGVLCCYKNRNLYAYDSKHCEYCSDCKREMQPMKLLYPVRKKNYSDDPAIKAEWERARNYLSRAAGITVFGYGAPATDVDALELLKESFRASSITRIAPFSIINLPDVKQQQMQKWEDIYDSRMFCYYNNFRESLLWRNPRVSLETLFDAILQQSPRHEEGSYSEFATLEKLQEFVRHINTFRMAV